LEVVPTQLDFFARLAGPNPPSQILSIRNTGTGTLNWQITEDCNWLSTEPTSGSSTGEANSVTLSVDMEGLAEGTHNCELIVSDPCATNSPQTVEVYLAISSLADGLVAWWRFDEGTGAIAYDSFGTNHGTLNGNPAWVTGLFGAYALDFDGDGDHIYIPDADSLTPPSAITIAWWVCNRGGQDAGIFKYAHCPNRVDSPGNSRAYFLAIDELTGKVRLRIHSSVDSSDVIESNTVVTLNQWHHVAATFDAGSAAIYIDGQLDNATALSVSSIMNDAQPLIIGGFWEYCDADSLYSRLNGVADEVYIYNRALFAEEVQQIYGEGIASPFIGLSASEFQFITAEGRPNPPDQILTISNNGIGTLNWEITEDCNWLSVEPNSGSSTVETDEVTLSVDISGLAWGAYNCELIISDTNALNSPRIFPVNLVLGEIDPNDLVSWWTFDEGDGNTAYDSAGDNHGTVCNANWTDGIIGGALDFDGVDDYVNLGNDSSLKPPLPVTLSAWINLSSLGSAQFVMAFDNEGCRGIRWYVSSAGNLVINYGNGDWIGGDCRIGKIGTTVLEPDTWYHIAAVVRGPTDITLYVYGVDDGGTYTGRGTGVAYSSADVLMGKKHNSQFPFGGKIDDVRVYRRSLSSEEVQLVSESGWRGRPAIGVLPGRLEFDANEGASNPASQTISIRNVGAGILDYHITENCPWLEVDPNTGTSGGEPNEVTVSVDISGLTGGEYGCELIISDPNAGNSPKVVDINLVVVGPVIELSAAQFQVLALEGGLNPEDHILQISNRGGGRLNWEIAEDCDWLSAEPNSGSLTSGQAVPVALSVDVSGLDAGTYDCQLTVWDPNAENSPKPANVNLVVVGPVIELSATEFEVSAFEAGPNPEDQILQISNGGGGRLDWQIIEDCNWLQVEPNIGSLTIGETEQVSLGIDPAGLSYGDYHCTLIVSDPNAENSPQTVQVALCVGSSVLLVPSLEYPTIQAAIDAACCGSTIIVGPGTYTGSGNCDIDFLGKAITLRSMYPEDPCVVAVTVIDCHGSQAEPHRGFYFHSAEGPDSVLAGLTITNGYVHEEAASGGGIRCSGSSPAIENCIVTGCTAWGVRNHEANRRAYGGGICCDSGSNAVIRNCQITGNKARGGDGGTYWHPEPGDVIGYCGGDGLGAGIYCHSAGGVTVENCTINNNRAIGGAGNYGGDPTEDAAPGSGLGGGIYGIVSIRSSVVADNEVIHNDGPLWLADHLYGGGIFCSGDSVITNCLIVRNTFDGAGSEPFFYGTAMYAKANSNVTIRNCTLAHNARGWYYGGNGVVEAETPANVIISNSIFYGNAREYDVGDGVTVSYSCLEQDVNGPGNIIGVDPCFAGGPLGDYFLSQVAAGQAEDSPCVDAGSDTAVRLGMDQCATRTDAGGDEGIVDMGYHYGNCGSALPAGDIDEDGDVD
ncbi:MAG: LamG-like jellyroll fold domain-containing protein, partial [Planctomycetota bacterium]